MFVAPFWAQQPHHVVSDGSWPRGRLPPPIRRAGRGKRGGVYTGACLGRHHHKRSSTARGHLAGDRRPPPARPLTSAPPTPRGSTTGSGATAEPNLAVYPSATSGTAGVSPYSAAWRVRRSSTTTAAAVLSRSRAPSAGSRQGLPCPSLRITSPDVVRNGDGSLTGYFDYRPKDATEALVAATSTDNGKSWIYQAEALEENPAIARASTSTTTVKATPTSSPPAVRHVSTRCSARPATTTASGCWSTP